MHEYVVLDCSAEFADQLVFGDFIYVPSYMGKEYTWQYVNLDTMEYTGWITGLHRRRVSRVDLARENEEKQDDHDKHVSGGTSAGNSGLNSSAVDNVPNIENE